MPSDPIRSVGRLMAIALLILGLILGGGAVYVWARAVIAGRDAALSQERSSSAERLALVEQGHGQWEARLKAATR